MSKPKKSYSEQLRDPRWQKKRLEVLNASGWKCSLCGTSTETLHVHHKIYLTGRDPWEYEAGQLAVLCESCHDEVHEFRGNDGLLRAASFAEMDGPGSMDECTLLLAGFLGLPGYENVHPGMRAMYEIGRFASALSYCRGVKYLPSKEANKDLLRALHYSQDEVSEWLRSAVEKEEVA